MGILYLKGIRGGIRESAFRAGKGEEDSFPLENLGNYLAIQGQLYVNTLRLIKKT